MVDYSICGIEVDEEKPYSKTLIVRLDSEGNLLKRELSQDSTGVKEFFAWAVQIFRVVYENKVVFADEMDRVLNPILSERVIAYINGMEHKGQFIFSTHNVLHLNLKTYMKEQIYFVTKNKNNLTSELYSLADFPDVRYETAKIYELYMKGVLGGTAFE
jgi:AAA15 family ATPase/GTPase